jgi:hypothetical protein
MKLSPQPWLTNGEQAALLPLISSEVTPNSKTNECCLAPLSQIAMETVPSKWKQSNQQVFPCSST